MTANPASSKHWWWAPALLLVALLGVASGGIADDDIFLVGLDLAVEHDDNIALADRTSEPELIQDDVVMHARPRIDLDLQRGHHQYGLHLAGDIRQGRDSDLEQQNVMASGNIHLRFEGGFGIRLFDRYVKTRFDQAIFFSDENAVLAEPGIATTDSNTYGAGITFFPRRVIRFDLAGNFTDDDIESGSGDTRYRDQRDVTKLQGRVTLPISNAFALYAEYTFEDQDSEQRLSRTFDDTRSVAGVTWKIKDGINLSLEAGSEEVDFADADGIEYDNQVSLLRLDATIDEQNHVGCAVGVDGYDEVVYQANYVHEHQNRSSFGLRARHFSLNSFSTLSANRVLDASLFGLRLERRFKERVTALLDGYYLKLSGVDQEDTTSTAMTRLGYDMRRMLQMGIYYRYSERRSKTQSNRYEDSRVGVFFRIHN